MKPYTRYQPSVFPAVPCVRVGVGSAAGCRLPTRRLLSVVLASSTPVRISASGKRRSSLSYVSLPLSTMTKYPSKCPKSSSSSLSFRFFFFSSFVLQCPLLASAALPKVDFDRMGHVGLAGSFAGLDLFDNSSSLSFDPTTSTLLSRAADGSLTRLGSTEAGGKINTGCALGDTLYVAGSFTSINGTSASNVVSYSRSEGTFSALGSGGPDGEVKAILCDSSDKKIWAGGSFSSPGSAVAVWDTSSNSWSAPPFGGLSGASAEVLSITTNSSAKSLFFAGSFVTTFGSNATINNTNNPNVPFSAGATPFSSSLVPIPLEGADITASPSTSDSQFSDINNILCPSGDDGPGSTWLAADGSAAVITVRVFRELDARGIRLGNTFISDHGTTAFSLTSIPDNTVQTLTYVDPATGINQTCSDPCPLQTNSSNLYQDFLFNSDVQTTGFQLKLTEWTGSSAGLHLMQLLSSGAFASAVAARNNASCYAPNASSVTLTGEWTEKEVTTGIAGTVQDILTATIGVGTASSSGPSITWMPYVSASGNYDVNLLVPGCVNFQDCDLRTSVKVTFFPGGGLDPTVTTVSQQVNDDTSANIYSGPVTPSSPDFVATVTMQLADNPEGSGLNGQYEIVADRIELILTSVISNSSSSSNGTVSTNNTTNAKRGFGFFEWPLDETSTVNAASAMSNSTETSLDNVGFELFNAIGSSAVSSTRDVIAAVAHHSSGTIFLGGNFSFSSGSNIVAYKSGSLSSLSSGGLNGPVTSMVLDGNTLYVGGVFTDTNSSSTGGKARGVVAYDVNADSWSPLQAGVNGEVTSVNFANNQIELTGSFTKVLTSAGSSAGASGGGFAIWDVSNSTWANPGGFLIGSMTFIGNSTDDMQILAGNVASSLKFGSTGFVMLQNGHSNDGTPSVSTLNVQLQDESGTSSSTTSRKKRRYPTSSSWLPTVDLASLFRRQSVSVDPLPADPGTPAPAVLAGVFWTNTSDSNDRVILGGNFSFTSNTSSESTGVIIYDLSTGGVQALEGNPINGTVRSIIIASDVLYIGGEMTVSGSSGLAIYNLNTQQLDMSGLNSLQAASGSNVVVRSLTASSSKSNAIVVAGSFSSAGSVNCNAICFLDTNTKQWSTLGSGINGEVASVAYGGDNQELLFASGSIALSDGTAANVAMFAFDNSTWTAVGSGSDLPGPVTAVTVDDGNSSSIFAAGKSSSGSSPFLSFWNGVTWNTIDSGFESSTNISQLTFVPLQDQHSSNSIIERDRMLLVSGSLVSSSFGNASSALYDGQSFFPYITTSTAEGTTGMVASLFSSIQNFSFEQRSVLAVGIVILISIAISAGVVFLLVLLGILWTLFARRGNEKLDYAAYEEDDESTHEHPSSLLEHINAATRTTILGAPAGFENLQKEEEEHVAGLTSADPFAQEHDGDHFHRAETPSEAMGMGMAGEEQGRHAHARYSFDGAGEGELPLDEGMSLDILDDKDPNWWYVRDASTGREGVVPAAYIM